MCVKWPHNFDAFVMSPQFLFHFAWSFFCVRRNVPFIVINNLNVTFPMCASVSAAQCRQICWQRLNWVVCVYCEIFVAVVCIATKHWTQFMPLSYCLLRLLHMTRTPESFFFCLSHKLFLPFLSRCLYVVSLLLSFSFSVRSPRFALLLFMSPHTELIWISFKWHKQFIQLLMATIRLELAIERKVWQWRLLIYGGIQLNCDKCDNWSVICCSFFLYVPSLVGFAYICVFEQVRVVLLVVLHIWHGIIVKRKRFNFDCLWHQQCVLDVEIHIHL